MTRLPDVARAAVLEAFGEPLVVRELPVPQQLEHGSLLVKVEAASVCGTDTHLWEGAVTSGPQIRLPLVLGHEMAGTVVAFGPGSNVDSVGVPLVEGDRVIWTHAACGRCHECVVIGEPSACADRLVYGRQPPDRHPFLTGAFAEYCYVVPGSGRLRVPDAVTTERAAAASCALRTVVHAFERAGRIEPHHRVVVQGAGPLGLYCVALAHASGVEEIAVIGAPEQRLEVARRYGATEGVSLENWTDAGTGDVVFECSGGSTAFAEGLRLTRPAGRYVVVGQAGGATTSVRPSVIVAKQLTVIGVLSAHLRHYWKALRFLERNADRFDWDAMLTSRFPLERVTDAVAATGPEEIKPVVLPWAGGSR
jgi:L-iditol 2-dehydrogenase